MYKSKKKTKQILTSNKVKWDSVILQRNVMFSFCVKNWVLAIFSSSILFMIFRKIELSIKEVCNFD